MKMHKDRMHWESSDATVWKHGESWDPEWSQGPVMNVFVSLFSCKTESGCMYCRTIKVNVSCLVWICQIFSAADKTFSSSGWQTIHDLDQFVYKNTKHRLLALRVVNPPCKTKSYMTHNAPFLSHLREKTLMTSLTFFLRLWHYSSKIWQTDLSSWPPTVLSSSLKIASLLFVESFETYFSPLLHNSQTFRQKTQRQGGISLFIIRL